MKRWLLKPLLWCGFRCDFVYFSLGNGRTDFDETVLLCSTHAWEGVYRLLVTVVRSLLVKWGWVDERDLGEVGLVVGVGARPSWSGFWSRAKSNKTYSYGGVINTITAKANSKLVQEECRVQVHLTDRRAPAVNRRRPCVKALNLLWFIQIYYYALVIAIATALTFIFFVS